MSSNRPRVVLHVDMNAFFASVEVKERPWLAGRPVLVGGTGRRGVVASASYEARTCGARSAMPMGQARRLCPQAVVLPGNFELYHSYSRRLHEVLARFSPLVEAVGLDEAYLDVSGAGGLFGPPEAMSASVRQQVRAELGLDCSVGAGPNKLVAKLASKAAKPRACRGRLLAGPGIVVVAEAEVLDFLRPLPVASLWGVGPAGAARLARLGVTSVRQVAALSPGALEAALGRVAGKLLHELAWGRDPRPVQPGRPAKSVGREETYAYDLVSADEMRLRVARMADAVASRVRRSGQAFRTVTLKVRYADFTTVTRSHTFPAPQVSGPVLAGQAEALLGGLGPAGGVRLLGVSASGLVPAQACPGHQLELGLALPGQSRAEAAWARVSAAVDQVRARFGDEAVAPGSALARAAPRTGKGSAPAREG